MYFRIYKTGMAAISHRQRMKCGVHEFAIHSNWIEKGKWLIVNGVERLKANEIRLYRRRFVLFEN